MRLAGKIIIVTGAAQGLGKTYSLRLAQEGAVVVMADTSVEKLNQASSEIRSRGYEVVSLRADVTSEEDTSRMAEETARLFGKIDVLINNAAIYSGLSVRPFHELDGREWDRVMEVNVKGSWLCAKAVFPYMRAQGKGKIINVSSASFFRGAPLFAHYVASKGAIVGLTRALARELGDYGICVNAIAPGLTMTKASEELLPSQALEAAVERGSLKRPEMPEDLCGIVAFLASDDSDFISGQTIVVDGGREMH